MTSVPRAGDALAPFALADRLSRGRRHAETLPAWGAPFTIDRHRVIRSAAFRRLSAKTQVFMGELGDYHRTRLTHTLEVANIARLMGRALGLNDDLIEALALVHDLGHPPFGHAGEDALDEYLAPVGGFNHNRHTLRIVEELEWTSPDFAGLNLSVEVLESQAARIPGQRAAGKSPLLEAQVVDAADSIAYNTHDVDDALELGLLSLSDLADVPLWGDAVERVRSQMPRLDGGLLKRAVLEDLIRTQVADLIAATSGRLEAARIGSVDDVLGGPRLVAASEPVAQQKGAFARLLFDRVYRHPKVLTVRDAAQQMLTALLAGYCRSPELLPARYRARIGAVGLERSVGDYVAGMTDRYARQQYERFFRSAGT